MKQTATLSLRSIRAFAHRHDDLPAFHAAYLVLTFMAAALFNLGFFAAVILVHMGLDVFKYRDVHGLSWKRTVEGVVRESLVDITLLLLGLVLAIYLHPSLSSMLGIKGLMLAELTILRGVGILTPKLKILYDVLKILSDIDHYLMRMHPHMGKRVGLIEVVCMISICVTVAMLTIAPILLAIPFGNYAAIMFDELLPWKL